MRRFLPTTPAAVHAGPRIPSKFGWAGILTLCAVLFAAHYTYAASLASTTYPPLALEHIQSAGVVLGNCSGVDPVVVPAGAGGQDARCFHTVAQFCVPAKDATVAPKCFSVDRHTKPANVPVVIALLKAEVFAAAAADSTIPAAP